MVKAYDSVVKAVACCQHEKYFTPIKFTGVRKGFGAAFFSSHAANTVMDFLVTMEKSVTTFLPEKIIVRNKSLRF